MLFNYYHRNLGLKMLFMGNQAGNDFKLTEQ